MPLHSEAQSIDYALHSEAQWIDYAVVVVNGLTMTFKPMRINSRRYVYNLMEAQWNKRAT